MFLEQHICVREVAHDQLSQNTLVSLKQIVTSQNLMTKSIHDWSRVNLLIKVGTAKDINNEKLHSLILLL